MEFCYKEKKEGVVYCDKKRVGKAERIDYVFPFERLAFRCYLKNKGILMENKQSFQNEKMFIILLSKASEVTQGLVGPEAEYFGKQIFDLDE